MGGEQILPPRIMPLWNTDHFKLAVLKKEQTQVFRASPYLWGCLAGWTKKREVTLNL